MAKVNAPIQSNNPNYLTALKRLNYTYRKQNKAVYLKSEVCVHCPAVYFQDRIGLKDLQEANKLQLLEVEGQHLQFTAEWFNEEIIDKYLSY